jgi:hypothetical protein
MVSGVKSFMGILNRYHPKYVNSVSIRTLIDDDYKTKLTITFPGNSGNLYPDISLYIRLVWGCDDVIANFDFDGTNHFSFNL